MNRPCINCSDEHADNYAPSAIQAWFAPQREPLRTLKRRSRLNVAHFTLTARVIYRLIDRILQALGEHEPMNGGRLSTLRNSAAAAGTLVFTAAILVFLCSSANAVQPPSDHCRAASKIEYDSAKKQFLLRNRFGAYVRTGRLWRWHYWYCQL